MDKEREVEGFEYELISSVLHDSASVQAIFSAYEPILSALGGRRLIQPAGPGRNLPVFFVLTGGTEGIALASLKARNPGGKRLPVLLIAHARHNSLPAALEIAARVGQDGGRAILILLRRPEDSGGRAEMAEAPNVAQSTVRTPPRVASAP